jgi:hypothetical protein
MYHLHEKGTKLNRTERSRLQISPPRRRLLGLLPFALLLALGASPAVAARPHAFFGSFGSPGSAAGQFDFTSESGLAVDQSNGDVYVADTGNHRIEKFSAAGAFIAAWGWGVSDGLAQPEVCTANCRAGLPGHSPGQFEEPTFIAVDNTPGGSGDVYVASQGAAGNERQTVTVSATGGSFTLSFTDVIHGTTTNGSDLVTNAWGPTYYVARGEAISGPGIPTGTTIVGTPGAGTLELSANATAGGTAALGVTGTTAPIPYNATHEQVQTALEHLEVLEGNHLEVLERNVSVSGSVGGPYTVEFIASLAGTNVRPLTADSSGLSGAAATATVATAADGFNANGVEKFDSSGNLITTWGGAPAGGEIDGTACSKCGSRPHFGHLEGILVKPGGSLLVLSRFFGYAEWTQSSGDLITALGAEGHESLPPIGIAVDPAGHVYVGTGADRKEVIQTSYCNTEDPLGPCPERNAHGGYTYHENFVVDPGPATGVAVDPSDEAVYLARYNPISNHSDIAGYDSEGNLLESSFGGNGEITLPAGIAVSGSDSDVYLADRGANRVEIFASGGPHDALTVTLTGTALGSVTSEPVGIACPSLCSASFPESTEVTLTATAPEHSSFLGWSGGGCSGTGPCQILLTARTSVQAIFAQDRPTLTTAAASAVTRHTATLTGTVDPEGDASSCRFEYGPTSGYGAEAPCASHPGSGAAPVAVSAQLWELAAGTTYHYRLVAANTGGATYGPDETFTTLGEGCAANAALCPALPGLPVLATVAIVPPKSPAATTTRALTNAQKLARALKACKKQKKKSARISCEKQTHRKYAPAKKKAKKSTRSRKRG